MTFKPFEELPYRYRKGITIRTTMQLFIPEKIFLDFFVKEECFAGIFLDEKSSEIGVKFHESNLCEENSKKFAVEPSGRSINIRNILRYFGILTINKRFRTEVRNEDGMMVFSIKELLQIK